MASAPAPHATHPELRDFWLEFKDIEQSKALEEEEETTKTPDEGEAEAAWLQQAGYGHLVNQYQDGKELSEEEVTAFTSSLSRQHAAVVRKRVDTLNATLKKKQKYTTKIDVRNIFPQHTSTILITSADSGRDKRPDSPPQKPIAITRPVSLDTGINSRLTQGIDNLWIKQCSASDSSTPDSPPSPVSPSTFTFSYPSTLTMPPAGPMLPSMPSSGPRTSGSVSSEPLTPITPLSGPATPSMPPPGPVASSGSVSSEPLTPITPLPGPASPFLPVSGFVVSEPSSLEHSNVNKDNPIKPPTRPVLENLNSWLMGQASSNKPGSPAPDIPPRPTSPRSPSSPSSPSYIACWRELQSPRSPKSPRAQQLPDVFQPDANNHRKNGTDKQKHRSSSFLKKREQYSMTGQSEEVQNNVELGVETLSVHPKDTFQRSVSGNSGNSQHSDTTNQLSPVSDTDITFDLHLDDGKDVTVGGREMNASIRSLQLDDKLPNFKLVPDKLGITRIGDISPVDMLHVQSLALIEITSMFDQHNIMYSPRRTKKSQKEQGLFGVPLQTLLENDQKKQPNAKIPLIFQEIIVYLLKHGLETEGILRVPGSVTRVKQLRQELEEKFPHGSFVWPEDLTPNDVAALMKQFLRDLPIPLLTNEYIDAFALIENISDKKQQLQALNLLILLLPDVNRNTLLCLLDFLSKVVYHSKANKMSLANVAMIMAPNLFLAPKVRSGQAGKLKAFELEITMATGTSNIMRMLIKYQRLLWTIPSALMELLRRKYEVEQLRRSRDKKIKFLNKKDKTEVYKKPALISEADFQEGVIRIQAPKLTKSSTAIQLDEKTTAGDIVSKFRVIQGSQTWDPRKKSQMQREPQSSHGQVYCDPLNYTFAGDNTYLFEVGGNIGERCLEHSTNMLTLYKVNPNAEWVIKQRGT